MNKQKINDIFPILRKSPDFLSVFRPPEHPVSVSAYKTRRFIGRTGKKSPVFRFFRQERYGEGLFLQFSFGEYLSDIIITREFPKIENYFADFSGSLVVADSNTLPIAKNIFKNIEPPFCVLDSGEENKNWRSTEKILRFAHDAKLGRDAVFFAAGGGVLGDLTGFAASVYKRGCRFVLVSTTLLGMVDASVGGKTGFDLFETKNLIGSFFPAEKVFIPLNALASLPQIEWKSGTAELIKTSVLSSSDDDFFDLISDNIENLKQYRENNIDLLFKLIEKAVIFKGGIVSEDPKEKGNRRVLLNLGHTFAHALESVCGLGKITHGEAVAWGMVRACELGCALGITPKERAEKITAVIKGFDYNVECPHPFAPDARTLLNEMKNDKKNKSGRLTFIVPDAQSARQVTVESGKDIELLIDILKGGNDS